MFALRPASAPPLRHLVCLDLVRSATRLDGRDHLDLGRRVHACRRVLAHARARGWEITHVHPRSASSASRPVEGLEPLPSERLVYRTGVSAFSNRPFRQTIKGSPEAELVLIGFSLSSTCLATALTAHDWGVPVALTSEAVLGCPGEDPDQRAADQVVRAIVSPFVRIAGVDELIEVRRTLRLVVNA